MTREVNWKLQPLLFAEIKKYAMDNDSKSIEDLNELVDELKSLESSHANNAL